MTYAVRSSVRVLASVLAVLSLVWSAGSAHADTESIEVKSSSVANEFPNGFRFTVEASAANDIKSIAIRLRIGQRGSEVFEYFCQAGTLDDRSRECDDLEPAKLVNGELLWSTRAGRYIPPGTIITYRFEIEDSEGNVKQTDPEEFIYYDGRFEWKEVTEGPVAVAYHGPVRSRAQLILDTILETLQIMGPVLGAEIEGPIRVTMYNNVKEMLGGLPPGSTTIRRELITAGQAFSEDGTLLTLGSGREAEGTAAHEVTHILVYRAGNSVFRRVPSWINEGLAEYGNVKPSYSYDIALDFAVATNRLLPLMSMTTISRTPEDAIIFYGQARSIVKLMIAREGPEGMKALMTALKEGKKVDDAIQQVYGLTLLELENVWRESVGASLLSRSETGRAAPTPLPRPAILPYSLTPQAEGQTVGSQSDEPTPTPEPEPTATPVPEPPPLAAAQVQPEAAAVPEPREDKATAPGGACAAPLPGGKATQDLSLAALLLGVVGLRFGRRMRV